MNANQANSYTGTMLGSGQITREPAQPKALPVPAAIDDLDKAVADLYNEIDMLDNRLSPILTAAPAADQGGVAPNSNSVAGRIETNARAINALCNRLSSLRNRLEV